MKPSLPWVCHRQTSSPLKTHTHTHIRTPVCTRWKTDWQTRAHLAWSLWLFSSLTFPLAVRTWAFFATAFYVSPCFRNSVWFCQVDGAGLRLWGEGKSCLCSVVFCSAQTDAQACVNDSLSPGMSAGCRAACYSLQVKCLWRHMERGKLTTRGNSPQQREVSLLSPPNKI